MVSKQPIKVVVILGPTSSGKSNVAIKLAKEFDGEIISADSRQVYKDMDLGTGKVEGQWVKVDPGRWNAKQIFFSEGVAHHLIDFVDPQDEYNVSHFKSDCYKKIREIGERGKLPIICGGTGFWISAVVDNAPLPEVKPDPDLRKELSTKTIEALYDMLSSLDPERAKTVDRKNKIRLIRAIEIVKTLGKVPPLKKEPPLSKLIDYFTASPKELPVVKQKIPLSLLYPSKKNMPAILTGSTYPVSFLQIGINYPKEILEDRIKVRLAQRFEPGMVEEIKMLKEKYGLSWKKIQSFGLGYYWIPLFLQGIITEDEMKERTYFAERGYAKRQRTWFKRDKRILWENEYIKIHKVISAFLQKKKAME